jgi:lipopolysaccharide biosynthesis glycosyltransferase
MHVACAADANYIPHAAAMLHSLLVHQPRGTVCVHFLHDAGLPPAFQAPLADMLRSGGAEIHFHPIDLPQVDGLPAMGRISRVMWYRVFLPELLPDVDRVLYLDCDVLVRAPLQPLWEIELDEQMLGAVRNVFEAGHEGRARALGLAGPAEYFNSGVLLLNLGCWRREDCSNRVLSYARAHADRLAWPDQDALNVMAAGRWLALHPRWNCQNSFYFYPQARAVFGTAALREALADPAIVHFEGGSLAKPWHYLCKHPLRHAYFEHRRHTPWPQVELEGRGGLNRLLRPLPWRLLMPVLRLRQRLESAWRRRFHAALAGHS